MQGLGKERAIGAVLTVNGETSAVKKFIKDLPPEFGKPTDRSDLHVTIIDPREHTIDALTPRDNIGINRALAGLTELFHNYPIVEVELMPASHELIKIGNRYAVDIQESDQLIQLRGLANFIMQDELGVSLSSDDYHPHMSVTRIRRNSKGNSKQRLQKMNAAELRVPQKLHIDGFHVGEKIKDGTAKNGSNRKPDFNNRPTGQAHPKIRLR